MKKVIVIILLILFTPVCSSDIWMWTYNSKIKRCEVLSSGRIDKMLVLLLFCHKVQQDKNTPNTEFYSCDTGTVAFHKTLKDCEDYINTLEDFER